MNRKAFFQNTGIIIFCVLFFVLLFIGVSVYRGAGFFILDNPSALCEGQMWEERVLPVLGNSGRTDFMYSIMLFLTVKLFPNTPATHFMVQFAFFVVTWILAFALLRVCKVNYTLTGLCLLVGICSSTMAEQLYTIGKKEVFLGFSFLLTLLCVYALTILDASGIKKWLLYGIYGASLFFSFTIKETSLVIICPIFLFQIYIMFWKRESIKRISVCLGVCVLFMLCMKAYQAMFVVDTGYTSYELSLSIVIQNVLFYVKYNPDVLIWGMIGLVANSFLFYRSRQAKHVLFLATNLTGWAYIAGLCFWRWSMSYYLYPTTVLFALSLGGLERWGGVRNKIQRILITVPLVLVSILSLTYGIVSNCCIGSSHVDLSRAYTESIYTLLDTVQDGERVQIENYNLHLEPIYQTRLLLNTYFQRDIKVYGCNQSIWGSSVSDEELQLYGYTREMYEQECAQAVPQVGDYIVHYINNRNYYGQTRTVNPTFTRDAYGKLLDSGYTLELVDESMHRRWLWDISNGFWGVKQAEAGYQIWRVVDYIPTSRIEGVQADGWSGKIISITDYNADEFGQIVVRNIGSDINGYENNTVRLYVDDNYADEIEVTSGTTITLNDYVPYDLEMHTVRLDVEKTFIPLACNADIPDERELGINILYSKGKES